MHFFRQSVALLLLLGFIADIGLHLIPPLCLTGTPTEPTFTISALGGSSPHEDHSDCGIPEHGGAWFHHHHFPALVIHASFTMPQTVLNWVAEKASIARPHTPRILQLVRAPPFL